jgi:hypothetical protein
MLEPVGPRPASVILRLSTSDALKTHPFNGVFGVVEPLATDLKAEGFAMKSLRDEWD